MKINLTFRLYPKLALITFLVLFFCRPVFSQVTDTLVVKDELLIAKVLEESSTEDATFTILKKEENGQVVYYLIGRKADLNSLAKQIYSETGMKVGSATTSQKTPSGFEIMTDQDVVASDNMDRDYTMGFRMLWYGKYTNKNVFVLPIFRKIIDKGFSNFLKRKAKKYNNEPIENFAMDFGESAFTPFELRFDFVDSTDRPYSAILHFNSSSVREYDLASEGDLFKIFKNKKDSTIFALKYKSLGFRSKFTFGLIGKTPSNIAQWTQTAIHAANRAVVGWTREDPEGWHLAIGGDKDHPVINYDFSYFWNVHGVFSKIKWDIKKCSVAKNGDVKISKKQILPPLQFRFQPFVGGGLGFLQNQVNTGVNFELGFFNRPYTSIPNFDYGQVYDKDVLDGKGLEFSFLLNLQTHYWITNAMLQGLLVNDNSVYVVENEDLMRVTTFWNWGVKVSFHNTTLGFLISERSKTIKFSDRKHNFGRFFLRVDL